MIIFIRFRIQVLFLLFLEMELKYGEAFFVFIRDYHIFTGDTKK